METYLYEYDAEELDEGENEETGELLEITDGKKKETLVYPTGIDGIVRLNFSELTQKIIGCRIGEDVTTEYPWVFVKKEIIEDNLDLHAESSEFFPIQREILEYPDETMLIGLVPNTTDDPEFYVCLTANSRDIVINKIDALRKDQENRVKESVFRAVGEWHGLGSSREIDDSSIKKTRPLIQVEIEVKSEFLNAPIQLVDRNAEEQRDGYIELITTRQSFNNTSKRLVSRGEDTNPVIRDNNTQTSASKPINSWFQYNYEHEPINTKAYNEEERRVIGKFLSAHTNDICEELVMNSAWDLHADDCEKLIRDERDIQVPVPINYTEYQSYHNVKITKNKVINDLCWHPLWTGIAIAAYTDYSKSHNITEDIADNKIAKACLESNNVLVWSFNDCLMPKLMLECPRQIATVSISPLDGNIVIGGCDNGQIAAWSISGEIEKTEAVTVTTSAQGKYKRILKNLTSWMKEPTGSSTIHSSIMSSIQTGQRGTITRIIWLPTHTKIGKDGRFIELEECIDIEELGWQFMTSSEDGTVAFWDLKTRENPGNVPNDGKKAAGRSVSPLEALNGVFMPTYMLKFKHPEEERPIVITTMSFYVPRLEKIQIEPFSKSGDIDTRKYYKPIIFKPDAKIQRIIFVGTLEGHVGTITWEGFDFSTGLAVNREVVTWIWCNRSIHDGPVTHSVRSKYLNDVIVTIGGRAFAVWRNDFPVPVLTKKSTIRYTACSWGTSRPTLIILGRADGTVEIWDLIVKSHEACFTQNISGRIITGIYTHELHLNPQCIAFCDFNGAMRIVTAPSSLLIFEKSDVEWMRGFVDREVDRIQEFRKWQSSSKKSSRRKDRGDRLKKEDQKIDSTKETTEAKENKKESVGISNKTVAQQPRDSIEIAETNWKSSELKRMQRVILEKKGLRADDLDKRLAPVLELRRGARLKKQKIKNTIRNKDKIFEETMNFSFPEWSQRGVNDSLSANELPIQETHDATSTERTESKELEQLMPQIDTKTSATISEKIMKEFKEMSREFSGQLEKYSIGDVFFDLQGIIDEGERKRRSLDVELKKMTKKRPKVLFK